ncbi:PhzF family phenazine biosynthesis protein [Legionella jamestowniensis]|uniref:Epimerase n=1 Tax=Legionella jamestowniensis TaxID=455 RepID=A0A0W0UTZ5_9GAMM|nr:PhzF family phenazine biosynthesis protein [Legionella jamestowniensis]KTD11336.1 epimerase [Legionella jamestowniensis]SFL68889.1 phenazine biosynthesis protein PhzF family [Legionella jamestowniensis DSM 19215]
MSKQPMYQVDAFTTTLFGGNPAAVCPLEEWLDEQLMQSIATENNLSETAFITKEGDHFHIRWFTPNSEVALCGHATLASAYVIFEKLGYPGNSLVFQSLSGELRVARQGAALQLDFPALPYTEIKPSPALLAAMNIVPKAVYESTFDLLVICDDEKDVQKAQLDLNAISQLQNRGVILSAPSTQFDVYSRCFYPGCDVPEDPVTGSAHCVIAPFWSERLGKKTIHALQGLKRQGELICEVKNDRVLLTGECCLYLEGAITLA